MPPLGIGGKRVCNMAEMIMNGSCIVRCAELFGCQSIFSEAGPSRYVSQKCKHTRCPGRQAWVWNSARWGWSFSNSLSKPSIPTAMKERTEVHGFFKQVSAGVSNGVRIKDGGAAPEGRVCLWRKIRFSFLESHRVTRLAAGGTLSGGRYHDVTRAIAVVGSIRISCLR